MWPEPRKRKQICHAVSSMRDVFIRCKAVHRIAHSTLRERTIEVNRPYLKERIHHLFAPENREARFTGSPHGGNSEIVLKRTRRYGSPSEPDSRRCRQLAKLSESIAPTYAAVRATPLVGRSE